MIAALAVFVPTFFFLVFALALGRASKRADRTARRFHRGGLR